jgi:hypothetical protein
MGNVALKTIIGSISQGSSPGELPKGSGTMSDPYNWYRILDPNNPNGCHTEWINQNAYVGWIKVLLEGGVTYSIGQSANDESGNQIDGYLYVYDLNFEILMGVDNNAISEIDGFTPVDASDYFTPEKTGYYYIKAESWNNNYPDRKVSLHCHPAPINEGGSSPGGGNLIEADENCYVIEVQIDDTSSSITISDEGGNYGLTPIIDWGDGTLIENDWNSTFEHYYNETGTYKIIWKNGYSEAVNSFSIGSPNRITNVPQLSYYRNDWNSLFAYCNFGDDVTVNFGNPPENLTSASNMFYYTSCNTIRIICGSNVLSDFPAFFNFSTIKYFYASDDLFGRKNDLYINLNSAFSDCYDLEGFYTEDGVNGGYLHYSGNFNYMFKNCYNLYLGDGDWNDMQWIINWALPLNSRFGATRNVRQMFYDCYNVQGTVEPAAFWNNSEVNQTYYEYEMCFTHTKIENINAANANGWA